MTIICSSLSTDHGRGGASSSVNWPAAVRKWRQENKMKTRTETTKMNDTNSTRAHCQRELWAEISKIKRMPNVFKFVFVLVQFYAWYNLALRILSRFLMLMKQRKMPHRTKGNIEPQHQYNNSRWVLAWVYCLVSVDNISVFCRLYRLESSQVKRAEYSGIRQGRDRISSVLKTWR